MNVLWLLHAGILENSSGTTRAENSSPASLFLYC